MSRARRAPTNAPVTPPTDLDAMLKRLHLPTVRLRYALDRQVSFLTLDLSGMAGWLAGGTAGRVAPLGPLAADPALDLVAVYMSQAPGASRQHYRRRVIEMVYGALVR